MLWATCCATLSILVLPNLIGVWWVWPLRISAILVRLCVGWWAALVKTMLLTLLLCTVAGWRLFTI